MLQLYRLLCLLLTVQTAYWLLGSGAEIILVQSGTGGVQSQAIFLSREEKGENTASNLPATLPPAKMSHTQICKQK